MVDTLFFQVKLDTMIADVMKDVPDVDLAMIRSGIIGYADQYPQKGFAMIKGHIDKNMQVMTMGKMKYEEFAKTSPDMAFKAAMTKYQAQIAKLSALANKALQFTPPSDLETSIFKFLGLKAEKQQNLFEPVSSKFIIVFNKQYIFRYARLSVVEASNNTKID